MLDYYIIALFPQIFSTDRTKFNDKNHPKITETIDIVEFYK